MSDLKHQLIKLGSAKPELKDHIRPVLDRISAWDGKPPTEETLIADMGKEMRFMYDEYLKMAKSFERALKKLGYKDAKVTPKISFFIQRDPELNINIAEFTGDFSVQISKDRRFGLDLAMGQHHKGYWFVTDNRTEELRFNSMKDLPRNLKKFMEQFLPAPYSPPARVVEAPKPDKTVKPKPQPAPVAVDPKQEAIDGIIWVMQGEVGSRGRVEFNPESGNIEFDMEEGPGSYSDLAQYLKKKLSKYSSVIKHLWLDEGDYGWIEGTLVLN